LLYRLSGDVATTDANPVTVLTIPVEANKTYEIDIVFAMTAGATTDGYKASFSVPSGATWTMGILSGDQSGGEIGFLGMKAGASEITVGSSQGATETPDVMKARITVGGTGGNAVFQIAREAANNVTVEAGTCARVREVTTGTDIIVVAMDTAHSDNTTYATALSFPASANTTYMIDVVLHFETASLATGVQPRINGIPSGATVLAGGFVGGNGAQFKGVRRDSTEVAMANSVTTFQLVRFKMLLAVGANAGTLTIEFQPEVNSSAVTCKAGSFGTIRDVTSTVSQKAMDQSSTDNTNYADVFTQAIGANESYWFEWVGAYTASAVGVGLNQRMNGIPSGSSMAAVLRDCENSASTDGAAILARDGTAIDNTTSEGATEALFTGHGAIVNGATPGTLAWQFKINNGDTGTVTIEAGSWFFAEECDLQA
jgi:hypothetical protein